MRNPRRWPDKESVGAFERATEGVPDRLRGRLRMYFERFDRGSGAGLYRFRRR